MSDENKKFPDEIGGVWVRKDKNNNTYMTLSVKVDGKEMRLVGFKNKHKSEGDNRPNYRLYVSQPLEQKASAKPAAKPVAKPAPVEEEESLTL